MNGWVACLVSALAPAGAGGAAQAGALATVYAQPTWRPRLELQTDVLIALVGCVTTFYRQRLISRLRRGATERMLDGYQQYAVDTAAPRGTIQITFSRSKRNQRTLQNNCLLTAHHSKHTNISARRP